MLRCLDTLLDTQKTLNTQKIFRYAEVSLRRRRTARSARSRGFAPRRLRRRVWCMAPLGLAGGNNPPSPPAQDARLKLSKSSFFREIPDSADI